MKTFTASRLSDDNGLFPCKIIVSGNKITVRIPGFFNNQDKDISFDKISEVSVETPLIGYSTVTFYTTGIGVVAAHGFTKSEVKEIKRLIEGGAEESESYKSVFFDNDGDKETETTDKRDSAQIKWIAEDANEEELEKEKEERNLKSNKKNVEHKDDSEKNASEPKSRQVSPEILRRLEQLEKKEKNREREIEVKKRIEESKLWLTFLDNEISEGQQNAILLYTIKGEAGYPDEEIDTLKEFLTSEDYAEVIGEESANGIMDLIEQYTTLNSSITAKKPKELSDAEFKSAMKQAYEIFKNSIKEREDVKSRGTQNEMTQNFIKMKERLTSCMGSVFYSLTALKSRWPQEMQSDEFRSLFYDVNNANPAGVKWPAYKSLP